MKLIKVVTEKVASQPNTLRTLSAEECKGISGGHSSFTPEIAKRRTTRNSDIEWNSSIDGTIGTGPEVVVSAQVPLVLRR